MSNEEKQRLKDYQKNYFKGQKSINTYIFIIFLVKL